MPDKTRRMTKDDIITQQAIAQLISDSLAFAMSPDQIAESLMIHYSVLRNAKQKRPQPPFKKIPFQHHTGGTCS